MQERMRFWVLSLSLLCGCAESQSPNSTIDSPVRSELDAAVSGRHCDARAIQDEAAQLVRQAAACRQDSECENIEVDYGQCLNAFLCSVSVNKRADLALLRAEATRLSDEYKQCPGLACAIASCAGPFAAKCDEGTHLCTFVKP